MFNISMVLLFEAPIFFNWGRFTELNKDSNGNIYLVVHSGSRYLGKQVAEYYQNLAYSRLTALERQKLALKEMGTGIILLPTVPVG